MSNKTDKKQISPRDLDPSQTNLNSKWYGEYGVSPINFVQVSKNSSHYVMFKGPPGQIPLTLLKDYIMDGKVTLRWWYCNEEADYSKIKHISETYVDLNEEDPFRIDKEKEINFDKKLVDDLIQQIENRTIRYYGDIAGHLMSSLEKFPIQGKSVCVMGSTHPIVEAYCIHYGANPTTIEYTKIMSNDERLKTVTVSDYYNQKEEERELFDAGISISSFEHDGLGKYGDPLDPWGDIKAMKRMKDTIKKGGILYLAVPIGKDRLDWNAHRVYGRERLPLLLDGWKTLKTYELSEEVLDIVPFDSLEEREGYGYKHSLFVLENE
tara:strand:+ start:108 stop:1076 length:969 start_codon:yes stop_codon:yes gene_type:complete